MIKAIDNGYGYPTSGAVPEQPSNQWIPTIQSQNGGQGPYAFSTSAATSSLTSHGWAEVGGVMTCQWPGSAANECGAGIASGAKLSFTMDYATGIQAFQEEVANYKSVACQAGIQLTWCRVVRHDHRRDHAVRVRPKCNWDMLNFGGWNFNGPGFEPTGEPLFATGASSNSGSYSNTNEDKLITETHTSSRISAFDTYATYTAQQLPFIWMPNAYTVAGTASKLTNVAFNPLGDFLPEYWDFTK